MKYNISETPVRLREYGRNIQSMIEYAKSIEDKETRTTVANEIIRIMSNLNPSVKDIPDYKQKLWESLFQISDYDFDVESPYPVPEKNTSQSPVKEHIGYNKVRPRFRQYGANIQLMMEAAAKIEDEETRKAYINGIANTMQLFVNTTHRDAALDATIASHMTEMTKGKLVVSPDDFTLQKISSNQSYQNNKHRKHNKHKNKHNNKRNNNKGNQNKRRRK